MKSRLDLVVGALAVDELLLRVEALAARAVEPRILPEVDVAARVDARQYLLHELLMVRVRGADEVVVANAASVPRAAEERR